MRRSERRQRRHAPKSAAPYLHSFVDGNVASYPLAANARTLSFDAAARITGLTDTQPAANQLFDYDPLDRLTGWIAPQTNQSYGYDANGNRSRLTIGAAPYAYAYPAAANRLASVAGPQAKSYSYDAAGNLTGDGVYAYTYDGRGRLSRAMDLASWRSVNYLVNGLGQRVAKSGWLEITDFNFYVYDEAGRLVGEYDAYGAPIAETVYLGETPVAVIKGGQVHYVYADHLNTPRVITDQTNKIVWRWDSNPFGTDAANDDPDGDGIKFTYNNRFPGQYYDRETGLHYNYYRDNYFPDLGRYGQSDPLGLVGKLSDPVIARSLRMFDVLVDLNNGPNHLYAYTGLNPVSRTDRSGLAWDDPGNSRIYDPTNNCSCTINCMQNPNVDPILPKMCKAIPSKKIKVGKRQFTLNPAKALCEELTVGASCQNLCSDFCSGNSKHNPCPTPDGPLDIPGDK